MMSQRDYEEMAVILNEELYSAERSPLAAAERIVVASVARSLAHMFSKRNPRFSYDKFYKACGLDAQGFPMEMEAGL